MQHRKHAEHETLESELRVFVQKCSFRAAVTGLMNAPISAGSTFIEDASKELCGGNRTDEVLLFINIALILNQVHRGTQGAQLHAIKKNSPQAAALIRPQRQCQGR